MVLEDEIQEGGARMEVKIGSSGSWAMGARWLAVSSKWRYRRGGSAASTQRLRTGLVRKAPRAILRAAD